MKLDTFKRLIKFMMLTTSDNEHEASGAMKMANTILAQENLTWERVLNRSVTIIADVEENPDRERTHDRSQDRTPTRPAPQRSHTRELDDAFEILSVADLNGSFGDLINDIHHKYLQGVALSFKQREVVLKAAQKEQEKGLNR